MVKKWYNSIKNYVSCRIYFMGKQAHASKGMIVMEKQKKLLIDEDVGKSLGSSDYFKEIVVASSEAIAVSDPGGRLIYVNPAHEKLFGRSLETSRSLGYWDYYSEKSVEKYHQEILPVIERGETWKGLIEVLDSSGKPFSLWQRIYATHNKKGEIQYCFTLMHEFRERKAEKNLRKAQQAQAIGTLAGGIAHEFNNILWIIMANAEIAAGNLPEGHGAGKNLQRVEKACARGADLVQQILSFSRQDEHRAKPLDIMPITKELLKFLRSSIPTTIEIRQNIKTQSAIIMANPSQMHQTLINLSANAVDAMGGNPGVLEISMTDVELDRDDMAPGEYIRLSVKDTGMGMEPEVMERVFEPFFTTKDVGEGRGMGLAVIHGIVENCEGSIEVHSEPGKGTTFHLFFPKIKNEKGTKSGSGSITLSPGRKKRILFVDDDKEIANTGKEMLEGYGFQVELKTCSEEALKTFREIPDRFDLVIADMVMPKMTGEELAEALLRIRPGIPVILCTGYDEETYKERARKIGIKAVLMKPVTGRGLVNAIMKALSEEI